jgi:SAM-dependent methyltransferase
MAERLLVPIYVPKWLHEPILKAKRTFIPSKTPPLRRTIDGERNVEWSFLSAEMPQGPGNAIEFGCEQGYMSLLAAQRGFQVVANDLQSQAFTWEHPNVKFLRGDLLNLRLPTNHFDVAINCSSVEHVGVAGRYGIEVDEDDGDIDVMNRLAQILKPGGVLLMSAPCGQDAVMRPWCRVYGAKRLPALFASFSVAKQQFWIKNKSNQWESCARETALSFEPVLDPFNSHGCAYALGCFVLRRNAA